MLKSQLGFGHHLEDDEKRRKKKKKNACIWSYLVTNCSSWNLSAIISSLMLGQGGVEVVEPRDGRNLQTYHWMSLKSLNHTHCIIKCVNKMSGKRHEMTKQRDSFMWRCSASLSLCSSYRRAYLSAPREPFFHNPSMGLIWLKDFVKWSSNIYCKETMWEVHIEIHSVIGIWKCGNRPTGSL